MKKICIVTSVHLSYNPRVVKEADTFYEKGYDVVVVTINGNNGLHQFDKRLMASKKWKLRTLNFRKEERKEKIYWLLFTIVHLFFGRLSLLTYRFGIAERAALKGYSSLLKLAKSEMADIYIVHHAEALAVGYYAAKQHGAKLGFDAEDFQTGMAEGKDAYNEEKLHSFLESKYLPHFQFFTAASKGIGEMYQKKYKLGHFHTILNVFPKENIVEISPVQTIKFYWYSQVIGPNRSLETLLSAAAHIKGDFELHLRGKFHSSSYESKLLNLIDRLEIGKKVFFHSPILADEIILNASKYDVGLALESDVSIYRNICVTNKIFTYLMAGLAIVGTDTLGQQEIFKQFNEAVRLCKKNDVSDLSRAMQFFVNSPQDLFSAKMAARAAAMKRYNWEQESRLLMSVYEQTPAMKVGQYI